MKCSWFYFFGLLHWKHITLFHYYANRKEYWVSSCRFHVWSECGVGYSFSNMVMVKRRWKGLGKAWYICYFHFLSYISYFNFKIKWLLGHAFLIISTWKSSQKELEKQPAYDYIRWSAYRSWVGYGAEEDFYKQTYLRYLGLSSSKHRWLLVYWIVSLI